MDKARHAFGALENIDSAISAGTIDAFDILFVKDAEGKPYVGWVDKNGQKVIVNHDAEFAALESQLADKVTAEELAELETQMAKKVDEATVQTIVNTTVEEVVNATVEEVIKEAVGVKVVEF